ncbi:uncharacterized protein [Rutidosis leptorrhynchoides]|uniref:uncharacterized protein n=1 Tax=Rutidosis leptorrhynchoides TaxID=125765 RepID=UPI003A99A28A
MILKLKNSDFAMAKRLKRRFAQHNKDRAGCMSGIISVFDFRHGRFTRRMLEDHSPQMTDSTTDTTWTNESPNIEESETAHTRVKELMEEEMHRDQTGDHEDLYPENFTANQVPSQKTSQYRDLEDFVNKLLVIPQIDEEKKPKSLERSNSLDHERFHPSTEEPVTRKNHSFFRRRSKSHECLSLNDNNTPPLQHTTNGSHHKRSVSHFSFMEIKKKLKNAIRRSPRNSGCPEKPVVDKNSGWSSPNRDHFYSERFFKISNGFKEQDEVSRLCKSERKLNANIEFGDTNDTISDIYLEAKKHLSEMLNHGDVETESTVENQSRSLGKLLSFRDYKYSGENSSMVNESQPIVMGDEHQESKNLDEVHQAEGIVEITNPSSPEKNENLDASHLTQEDELPYFPIIPHSESSFSINRKNEEVESTLDDKTGKPSPVSVLDPLHSDEDISPSRTISRSSESSFQPLRIRFQEESCNLNHIEDEESVYEYVESVLLASDLNWDEFEKRWLSSAQILDSSLYHELQLFSSRPTYEQRLLFDTTNEILNEVCDHSLDLFPKLSYFKPNISPVSKGMNLIKEVWERIESRLNCHYRISLDQLIKKDFEVLSSWTDLHSDTREIVMEIEELMFDDMIDDMVLSILQD